MTRERGPDCARCGRCLFVGEPCCEEMAPVVSLEEQRLQREALEDARQDLANEDAWASYQEGVVNPATTAKLNPAPRFRRQDRQGPSGLATGRNARQGGGRPAALRPRCAPATGSQVVAAGSLAEHRIGSW